jgi:hypothetical protein
MIWNINCRRIRRLLALSAGNDLEQRECHVAERHLAVCPECREVWERLQQSQQVLERASPVPFEDAEGVASVRHLSVWPAVARQIRSMNERVVTSNWRDWLPAGAVAAACVAIISVSLPEVPVEDGVSTSVVMSSPATFDPNPRHLGPFPLGLHLGLHREGDDRRNDRQVNRDAGNPNAGNLDEDDPPSF